MSEEEPSRLQRLTVLVARANSTSVAVVAGVGIAAFVIFGILQRTLYPRWNLANLDSEASIATWYAAALLWAAAIVWILVALQERPRAWPVFGWSALMGLLALDEANAVHEDIERWLETDWQVLYLPIMALGAFVWWRVVTRYRPSGTATLLVAAAITWAVVLVLELVQNWGGAPARASIYNPTMISEEALEMIGSTLVVIAGVRALRRQTLRG